MTESSNTNLNRLKGALAAGSPSFGVFATMPSIQAVQTLASAGVDWLITWNMGRSMSLRLMP